MPRKTRRPPPDAVRTYAVIHKPVSWPGYLLTALIAAALGSGVTYLAMRPSLLKRPASPVVAALPPDAARVLGYWYEDHQDWASAITLLTQAIAGGLDNPDVRTDLGVAYFKSGQLQQALGQYATAQREDPHHENSLFNQGVVYAQLGSVSQAISIWQQYLQRFPKGQHIAAAHDLIAQLQAHAQMPTAPTP